MKNVNGMKNLKQMKKLNVKVILLAIAMLTISLSPIKNSLAGETITEEDYIEFSKGQLEGEKRAAENTAKKVKEAMARKKVEYTQKNLQEDMKLSIEELQKKYPVKWFDDRFNSSSDCEFAEDAPSPLPDYCKPERYFLDDFTDQEILSIFVNTEWEQRETNIKSKIMCDIKDNGEKSKWYILKDILYKKEVLQRFNCLISAYNNNDNCRCLPDEDYVIEVYYMRINKNSEYDERRRLKKFSPFFQEKYQEYKLNLNKNKK